MADSPTQRTLKLLRERGYRAQVVERWQQIPNHKPGMPPGVRIDLFGCIDVVALGGGAISGWQACSGGNHSTRRTKLLGLPSAFDWVLQGGRLFVISWAKRGGKGKRKLWAAREEEILAVHFDEAQRAAACQPLASSRSAPCASRSSTAPPSTPISTGASANSAACDAPARTTAP